MDFRFREFLAALAAVGLAGTAALAQQPATSGQYGYAAQSSQGVYRTSSALLGDSCETCGPVDECGVCEEDIYGCDPEVGCDPCIGCDPCSSCDTCYLAGPDEAWSLMGDSDAPFTVGGWIQAGYHDGSTTLFNDRPDEINLHQAWAYIERVADGSCGLDFGFRFDAMYGIDGTDTQAFGNVPGRWDYLNGFDHGPQSWALPQAYVEAAYGDLSVIAGHFYTLIGYEVVTAPDNFFYSHALTMYNAEPFTHTGALATYSASDDLTIYGGYTFGWDTGFDDFNGDASSFLGGASYSVTEDVALTYILTAGDFGWRGEGYSHSVVADWSVTDNLNYVIQSDLVRADEFDAVGVNQYLFYSITDCLAVGARGEWFKSDGVSFYEITYGVNYSPIANMTIRPEYRHQWSPTDAADFADNDVFGVDAYVTF
ncbi:Secreted protein containing DUF1597 [Planctomycetales bacterium 10988]|nr:Secreted protein containing DUF1597 [Planctomycetales bacterium 10988]